MDFLAVNVAAKWAIANKLARLEKIFWTFGRKIDFHQCQNTYLVIINIMIPNLATFDGNIMLSECEEIFN